MSEKITKMEVIKGLSIQIYNEIIKNEDLKQKKLLVYLGITSLLRNNVSKYYINDYLLMYELYGNLDQSKKIKAGYIDALHELVNEDWINIESAISKSELIININDDKFKRYIWESNKAEKFYTTLYIEDIRKILNTKQKNVYEVVKFYCTVMSTLTKSKGSKQWVGFTSQEFLADEMNITEKTVGNYFRILEKYEIIYIYNTTQQIHFDGKIQSIPNAYGRFCDKDKIITVGQSYENDYCIKGKKIEKRTRKVKNETIGLANMYHQLTIRNPNYSEAIMKKIYEYVVNFNKICKKKDIKDLSLFAEYDFYKQDTS